jgi:methionyl-tRNA formyltransferase
MAQRIVFMGTPDFAVPTLERLAADRHDLLVVTQPPRPAGRGLSTHPTAVRAAAERLGLEVIERGSLRAAEAAAPMGAFAPDFLVVACFGLILPPSVLALPRHMPVNLHPSLLPRHRGAAPVQWTLWCGDSETGVTAMRMDAGIDTGDILLQERTPVGGDENAIALAERLSHLGADLIARTIAGVAAGEVTPSPQGEDGVTHAPRLTKEHGHLDWGRSAVFLDRQVRAVAGWPGARAALGDEVIEILRAEVPGEVDPTSSAPGGGGPGTIVQLDERGMDVMTGEGRLRLLAVKPAGKGAMAPAAWARGRRFGMELRWRSLPGALAWAARS